MNKAEWKRWEAGNVNLPLPPETYVEIRCRNGRTEIGPVGGLDWRIDGSEFDIVEYREVDGDALRLAGLPAGAVKLEERRVEERRQGSKPTNPKDLIGSTKLPLNLVPDSLTIFAAMSFAEGASKYGAYNWRAAGVRASIYRAALERHLKKWWNGEWADKKTKVPHLASVIACAAIILDARSVGKLVDDRPPTADVDKLIADAEEVVKHLYEMHKDMTPHHWTVHDEIDGRSVFDDIADEIRVFGERASA